MNKDNKRKNLSFDSKDYEYIFKHASKRRQKMVRFLMEAVANYVAKKV